MTTTVSSKVPATGTAVKDRRGKATEHDVAIEVEGHTFHMFEDEPRVRDLDFAAWLGFDRPRNIRQLIERHRESGLLDEKEVCCMVQQTGAKGGRPGITYWLSHTGAVKIAAKSEGPRATAILREVVRVWDLVRRRVIDMKAPRQPKAPVYKPHLESAFAMLGMTQKADRPLPVRVEWLVAAAEHASGMDLSEARQRAVAAARTFDGEVPLIEGSPWHAGQRALRNGLATRLPELRKRHRLSQAQLARRAGVSTTTIQAAETGESGLLFETALAIAHVLGCPVEDLVAEAA